MQIPYFHPILIFVSNSKTMKLPCTSSFFIFMMMLSNSLFAVVDGFSPSDTLSATAAARVGKPPPFKPSKRMTSVTSATTSSNTRRDLGHRISVVGKAPKVTDCREADNQSFTNHYEPQATFTSRKKNFIESYDESIQAVQAIFCGYTSSSDDILRLRSANV